MNETINKIFLGYVRMILKIVKPWKKRVYGVQKDNQWEQRYVEGWNDCLKEFDKTRKELLEHVESKLNGN